METGIVQFCDHRGAATIRPEINPDRSVAGGDEMVACPVVLADESIAFIMSFALFSEFLKSKFAPIQQNGARS